MQRNQLTEKLSDFVRVSGQLTRTASLNFQTRTMCVLLTCLLCSELTEVAQLAKDVCVILCAWEVARECLPYHQWVLWISQVAYFRALTPLSSGPSLKKIFALDRGKLCCCCSKGQTVATWNKGWWTDYSECHYFLSGGRQERTVRTDWNSLGKSESFRAFRTLALHIEIPLSCQYFLICLLWFSPFFSL